MLGVDLFVVTCQVINRDTLNGLDDTIFCPNFDTNRFVYGDSSTPTTEATALSYWRFNSAMDPEFSSRQEPASTCRRPHIRIIPCHTKNGSLTTAIPPLH